MCSFFFEQFDPKGASLGSPKNSYGGPAQTCQFWHRFHQNRPRDHETHHLSSDPFAYSRRGPNPVRAPTRPPHWGRAVFPLSKKWDSGVLWDFHPPVAPGRPGKVPDRFVHTFWGRWGPFHPLLKNFTRTPPLQGPSQVGRWPVPGHFGPGCTASRSKNRSEK